MWLGTYCLTDGWDRIVQIPYLVYIPERDRLLLLLNCDSPLQAMCLCSDDRGASWSEPSRVDSGAKDVPGGNSIGTALTHLGGGRLLLHMRGSHWFSSNCGATWGSPRELPPSSAGEPWREWDPPLVDRAADSGEVTRLMSFAADHPASGGCFQGYIRFSFDAGQSWTGEICVPQWHKVNEVAFIRAANGHIVAACRTDNPDRFKDDIDHFGGLAVSISADDGQTWSALDVLYEYGRHHPSMVLMPDGRIVMSYIVREGYPEDAGGYARFGIEAVVSSDHGATWDVDDRYILAEWAAGDKSDKYYLWAPQGSSTVLLPDGVLLTAYSSGCRIKDATAPELGPRDVTLIRWRLRENPLCAH